MGTLYIGVTSDLLKRVWQHKNDLVEGFTRRYRIHTLVWYESHENMESAIAREKALKEWRRSWKLELIEEEQCLLARLVRGFSLTPIFVIWTPAFAGVTLQRVRQPLLSQFIVRTSAATATPKPDRRKHPRRGDSRIARGGEGRRGQAHRPFAPTNSYGRP